MSSSSGPERETCTAPSLYMLYPWLLIKVKHNVSFTHERILTTKILELQLQLQSFQWIFWFDLLAVQGTFRSLLQHHSLKASILWHSAFFTVLLSKLYLTTGKAIALTIWTFVGRVMSLLFNTLSRFVITFLPRSSCLLIS